MLIKACYSTIYEQRQGMLINNARTSSICSSGYRFTVGDKRLDDIHAFSMEVKIDPQSCSQQNSPSPAIESLIKSNEANRFHSAAQHIKRRCPHLGLGMELGFSVLNHIVRLV